MTIVDNEKTGHLQILSKITLAGESPQAIYFHPGFENTELKSQSESKERTDKEVILFAYVNQTTIFL